MSYRHSFLVSDSDKLGMLFFLLINVKNANSCWHFNIYEQEKFPVQLKPQVPIASVLNQITLNNNH